MSRTSKSRRLLHTMDETEWLDDSSEGVDRNGRGLPELERASFSSFASTSTLSKQTTYASHMDMKITSQMPKPSSNAPEPN